MKINEDWSEWVRHGSPRAHIRRGRSQKLSDASGRPPDAPWGRFKAILIDFGVDKGLTEFSGFFSYISLLWGTPDIPPVVEVMLGLQEVSRRYPSDVWGCLGVSGDVWELSGI